MYARLAPYKPHWDRAVQAASELYPRDWAGILVAFIAFVFVWRFGSLMTRQTRLMERQTELLEVQTAAASEAREAARETARARLRASLWRVQDILKPAAMKEASALTPDRRGAPVREARIVLEEEELNPALLSDGESAMAWRSALAAARLAEETAVQPETDANFFLMQAERVRRDLMVVRSRLAPESAEPQAPVVQAQAPAPAPSGPPPESSPLPKPTAGMAK
ncbi:hypothetical protein EPO15_01170 [bacterium]|nr:MAG: hypothetical protein EPO15_01170 [bacterium]